MKQIFIVGHGGPEKLRLRESPDPSPGAGEIRIRVRGQRYQLCRHPRAPGPVSRFTQDSLRRRIRSFRHRWMQRVPAWTSLGSAGTSLR